VGSHGTCDPWALLDWFNDVKVEKQLGKLDGLALDPNLNKEAMLGKHDDVKPNLESNYTFAKSKEQKKSLYLKFGSFRSGIVWNTNCFMHRQIETRKVMNLSTLNPWKLKSLKQIDNVNNVVVNCMSEWIWKLRGFYFENCHLLFIDILRITGQESQHHVHCSKVQPSTTCSTIT